MSSILEQVYGAKAKKMGRAEGRAEGRVEGRVEGRAIGMIEGKQDDLILFLIARFGAIEERVKKKIRATKSVDKLNHLIRQCATVERVEQLVP